MTSSLRLLGIIFQDPWRKLFALLVAVVLWILMFNQIVGERQRLDIARFQPVMDDYNRLRGWDVETGWPTREHLAHLGLEDLYDAMVSGAQGAQERLPELSPERPVVDHLGGRGGN